jgi:YHS domain-containing protein
MEEIRMAFIARVLKYLFWLAVVSWSVALLRRIVGKMASGNVGPKPYVDVPNNAVNQKLVRDPICGMHVAEGLALPLTQGEEILHFCSAECREKYLDGTQRISASA